ncbi:CBS domain-containing protein [Thermopolyspora sp. NPDC052614]|uniref:CBS domain-containing protein n=1 Tax=Thermopolyspora sp. NPDC052614 TaxID=3155682 RepID=UPI00342A7A79
MRVKVKDVMTADVASVHADTSFKDVAELLMARGVSAVPVVDAAGHVVGVVSELDLLHKEEFKDQYYREGYQPPLRARLRHRFSEEGATAERKARGDTAGELMTCPAVTVTPDTSVVTAVRMMEGHGVKRLPVVDEQGRLQGIVSRHDLLKVFVRTDADLAREIREDVLDRQIWVETSGVAVDVAQGVVTLSGRIARRSEGEIAVRMVQRVNGVVDVIDKLTWDEDDTPTWGGR